MAALKARAIEIGVPIYPLILVGSWTFKRLHSWNLATRGPVPSPFTRVQDGILPRPPFMADLLATLGMSDPVAPARAPTVSLAPASAIELPPFRADTTGWDEATFDILAPALNVVAWSPHGRTIAVAGDDGMTYLWDVAAGHVRAGLDHPDGVTAVAWSPDSRSLATAGDLGDVHVWNSVTATEQFRIATADAPTCLLAWSPDGELLATGGHGASAIQIWDAGTGEPRSVLKGRKGFVGPGSWSPTRPLLATTGNRRVWIWDVPTGTLRAELLTGSLWALCWSPDGQRLAAVDDETIGIWDVDAGTESTVLTSRHSGMRCVAWSPDDHYLAVGGCGQTVKLWQPGSPHPVAILDGHTDPVFSLSWSPDSRRLVTAGRSRVALL